ncbi:hypothetical protein [Methylobacterium sp. SD21]|uniref:hypothetical protein n=1 Tax=Methylobacterium litchii TaxID=3138810 RepID=UPI00313C6C41
MTVARQLIHASSNGDRWFICLGEGPADVFVLHEPNGPSGGRPSRIELPDFLASTPASPERLALLGMIGSLVAVSDTAIPAPTSGPEPGAAGAEPSPGEETSTT